VVATESMPVRVFQPGKYDRDYSDGWLVAQDGHGVWQVFLCENRVFVGRVNVTVSEGDTAEQRLARCKKVCEALCRIYATGKRT
jgi:hypothetical protein